MPAATAPLVLEIPAMDPAHSLPGANPAVLRPEPRQLPCRTSTAEPVAKPMPEPSGSSEFSRASHALPKHPHARKRYLRVLFLLLFVLMVAAVVFAVLTIIKNRPDDTPPAAPMPRQPQAEILNHSIPNPTAPPAEEPVPVLPVPDPARPSITQPPPDLPDGLEPVDPNNAAFEVLEKFLAAKSLAERLPLMETKTPEPELAKSSLAQPLPAASNIYADFRETNAVEQVIDFYYNVDFDAGDNRLNPQTILVRKRGDSAPKIVADPFLDTFGGRLEAYAKNPTDKAGIFQVIISPLASCNDDKVPNKEKKLTLKLLPRDNSKEIARAYFGRQSRIGRMLEDGTYSLSFGKARACTVMLRWNTEDRPETPYLEALDLKTLDWNP